LKASELIKELQERIVLWGDVEVTVYDMARQEASAVSDVSADVNDNGTANSIELHINDF
jgi:hypothetical protein